MNEIEKIIDFKKINEYFKNPKWLSEFEYTYICRDDLFILLDTIFSDLNTLKQTKIIVPNKFNRIQNSINTINEILEFSLSNLKISPLKLKQKILDIKVLLSQIREFECKK